ncbi:hypothetical protein DEU34_0404 [Microbacterium sp. AG1240]|uniref:hypothetical protein n=1 Tax=Microbacterium sp. AG1240 TaxID=2183992 RepID=UPI000F13C563|nr:hypothetical protein [Microbacterium sp. AG1240]RKT35899.1 hypothetical protein DEU34_0404 [Microbacterium sp. AG1240]
MTVHADTPAVVTAHRARPAAGSSGFTGSWPSVAAWGAGLIQAALGAGAIVGATSGFTERAAGVVLVSLGILSLFWGGANLVASRLIAPRLALAGAVAGVLAMFGLLAVAPSHTGVYAIAAGAFLLLVVGGACAVVVRRGADKPRDVGTLRGILGMLVAAAIIAVIVTPALGAAQDAVLLTDDGTVPVVTHDGH